MGGTGMSFNSNYGSNLYSKNKYTLNGNSDFSRYGTNLRNYAIPQAPMMRSQTASYGTLN